jgi:hypothetical protein
LLKKLLSSNFIKGECLRYECCKTLLHRHLRQLHCSLSECGSLPAKRNEDETVSDQKLFGNGRASHLHEFRLYAHQPLGERTQLDNMPLLTPQTSPRDFPRVGKGRAFAIASTLLEFPSIRLNRPWLSAALTHFRRALEQQTRENPPSNSASELWIRLNSRFDLDSIVDFTHAWDVWKNIGDNSSIAPAWDQELFFGTSAYSPHYHSGIKTLAQRQLDFVVPACRAYFKTQVGKAIDLGAGSGVQMSALRAEGIISSATCIDTPFVSTLGKEQSPEHLWIGGDLRNLNTEAIPDADLLWVGNLLHHYDLNANFDILNRFASKLSPNGVIVIQDYLVGSPGSLGLAAAALGVHFALTTNEGRNYTEKDISALCEEVFPEHKLDSRADGQFSSLLFYRRR